MERAVVVGWSYGAFVAAPYDWLDEAMERQIRKLFKRMSWFVPLLRPTGLSGRSFGSGRSDEGLERIRASLNQVVERNPNIKISARVASTRGTILRRDFRAVADAVREVAALARE